MTPLGTWRFDRLFGAELQGSVYMLKRRPYFKRENRNPLGANGIGRVVDFPVPRSLVRTARIA